MTSENSLDPDLARHFVGPDLDPILFDTLIVFLKEFFENVDFEKNRKTTKKHANFTRRQRVQLNDLLWSLPVKEKDRDGYNV